MCLIFVMVLIKIQVPVHHAKIQIIIDLLMEIVLKLNFNVLTDNIKLVKNVLIFPNNVMVLIKVVEYVQAV